MRTLEIFSGAGGLAQGLARAGFEHVSLVEINKDACHSLRKNFNPEIVYEGNILDFNLRALDNIDVIAGGPPCQPFSLGGKHQAQQDIRDMFPHAIECIRELRPKAFLFENVKGLLREAFSDYFDYIILRLTHPDCTINRNETWRGHLQRLKKLGGSSGIYKVQYKLLNSADYGVPQKRERVLIVGIRSDLNLQWSFPDPLYSQDRLSWEKNVTGNYWKKHNLPVHINTSAAKNLERKYGNFPPDKLPWRTIRDALAGIPDPNSCHTLPDHIYKKGARIYPGHDGSLLDEPAKTIKAGAHGVPGGENMIRLDNGTVRYMTVHEAKLIQSFSSDYEICGAWGEAMRQIGNAVPVKLAEIIGNSLFKKMTPVMSQKR